MCHLGQLFFLSFLFAWSGIIEGGSLSLSLLSEMLSFADVRPARWERRWGERYQSPSWTRVPLGLLANFDRNPSGLFSYLLRLGPSAVCVCAYFKRECIMRLLPASGPVRDLLD